MTECNMTQSNMSDENIFDSNNIVNFKLKNTWVLWFHKLNDNSGIRHTGLIAQEVKEVMPEAVYEDNDGFLNIAYGNLMGLMVEAIKELRRELKTNE